MENTETREEKREPVQDTIRQNAQKQEETQQTTDAEKTGKAGKVKNWFRAHPPLAVVKKHKKLTALVLVAVIVVAVVGTHLSSKKKRMANMMSQQTISTTELKKQDLKNTIAVNGTIASDTSRSISANVSNVEITEVCVSVGDEVKAGDVLCVLDSSSLEKSKEIAEKEQSASKTKAGMNTASAARELANTVETSEIQSSRNQEKIDKAADSYDSAVAEDNAAYESYEQALAARQANEQTKSDAQSSMSSAQSQMNTAFASFASALSALQGASSTDESFSSVVDVTSDLTVVSAQGDDDASAVAAGVSQLSAYQDTYNSAKSAYDTASTSYTEAANQTESYAQAVSEAYSQHKQAESSVSTAADAYDQAVENKEDSDRSNAQSIAQRQDSLKSAQIDQSTTGLQNAVTLENYTTQIEDCNVIAPFDGIITSVSVEAGDIYNGSEICVLQDNANLIVSLSVDEYDIPDIAKGMEAVIKTDATGDEEMSGTVTFVAPTPTTTTASSSSSSGYAVEVTITNPSERLRLGMTAKTSIITEEVTDVFVVPYECVETAPDGTKTITVVDADQSSQSGTAGQNDQNSPSDKDSQNAQSSQRTIQVETGLETDYYIEISSDELTEGMQVVVPQTSSSSSSDMMIMPGGGDMGGGGAPGGGMGGGGPM